MDISYRSVSSIPWHRLTTAYGRATNIPQLLEDGQYDALAQLIEHQSTLWQATPWALQQLLHMLQHRPAQDVTAEEIALYQAVASAFSWEKLSCEPVKLLGDLLQDNWLWPEVEDEDEDELEWEEEEPRGYEARAFVSYYVYSEKQLQDAVPLFRQLARQRSDLAVQLTELAEQLESRPPVQSVVERFTTEGGQ